MEAIGSIHFIEFSQGNCRWLPKIASVAERYKLVDMQLQSRWELKIILNYRPEHDKEECTYFS